MLYRQSLIVVLFVLAAVLVVPSFQVLANHTADVAIKIYRVRVTGDTDPQLGQGCSDVYVRFSVTSVVGQVRSGNTLTMGNVCPPAAVFLNQVFVLTPGADVIAAGPLQFGWAVKDEDIGTHDVMNEGFAANVPCNGRTSIVRDLAGPGDAASIVIGITCRPLAHAKGASELSRTFSDERSHSSQLELFDSRGRKVLSVTQPKQEISSLMTQQPLATGVYLYVNTTNVQGQQKRTLGKAVVLSSGQILVQESNYENNLSGVVRLALP